MVLVSIVVIARVHVMKIYNTTKGGIPVIIMPSLDHLIIKRKSKMYELKLAIAEYEDSGCSDMSKSLGFQRMPKGYVLMLNSDRTHYFWITDSMESSINWDKWAVYSGAMAHSNKLK